MLIPKWEKVSTCLKCGVWLLAAPICLLCGLGLAVGDPFVVGFAVGEVHVVEADAAVAGRGVS